MKTPISDLLSEKNRKVVTVSIEETVANAVRLMNEKNIGAVLVLEGESLKGIFSERDVLKRVVQPAINTANTKVSEVMTKDVVAIRLQTTVAQAMVIITDRCCRHLPVLEDGKLVGMVSSGDLGRHLVRDQQRQLDELTHYIYS